MDDEYLYFVYYEKVIQFFRNKRDILISKSWTGSEEAFTLYAFCGLTNLTANC